MRAALVGALSLFGFIALACSSEDSIERADFAERFATRICERIEPCCQSASIPYDAAHCQSSLRNDLTNALGTFGSNFRYAPEAAGSCLTRLEAKLAQCQPPQHGHLIFPGVFTGIADPGTPCSSNDECANGGFCLYRPTKPIQSTVCVPASEVPLGTATIGEACESNADCVGSAFCDAEVGVCADRHEVGPCAVDDACSGPTFCDTESGQCTPRLPDGASCRGGWQCIGGDCSTADGLTESEVCGPPPVADPLLCSGGLR